jgi:ArsR family transcriptional regulator
MEKNIKKYKNREKIIKAMAHASRLIIIDALNDGKKSVGDLVKMIGSDASTVSKHLSILKTAGLVIDKRDGNKIFYSQRCPCIGQYIKCIEKVIEQNNKEMWCQNEIKR